MNDFLIVTGFLCFFFGIPAIIAYFLHRNDKPEPPKKLAPKAKKQTPRGKPTYLVKKELTLSEAYMKHVYGHTIPNEVEEAWHIIKGGRHYYQTVSGRLIEV